MILLSFRGRKGTKKRSGYQLVAGTGTAGGGQEEERASLDKKYHQHQHLSFFSLFLQTFSKSLQHNATIFEQFNRLGLQPPITPADINKVSDQLRGLLVHHY